MTAANCIVPPERGRQCALVRVVGDSRPLNLGARRDSDAELEPGGDVLVRRDVSEEEDIVAMFDDAVDGPGGLDVLFREPWASE